MTYKGGLPFISFLYSDIVVPPSKIDLHKELRSFELVDKLRDKGQRVVVPNHMFVQMPIILHHPLVTIFLGYEEDRRRLFGFGWADIPFGKLFINKLRDLFLFFHQKGNQSSLFWLEHLF